MPKHFIMWGYKNMSRRTVKKSISLREDVFKVAESEADKFFGGNFSAYLTYLICVEKHGISTNVEKQKDVAETISKKKVMDSITNYSKSDENEDYIDSILNM